MTTAASGHLFCAACDIPPLSFSLSLFVPAHEEGLHEVKGDPGVDVTAQPPVPVASEGEKGAQHGQPQHEQHEGVPGHQQEGGVQDQQQEDEGGMLGQQELHIQR